MRKGFLQGEIVWESKVLEELLGLLDQMLPQADVDWTQKVVVNYTVQKQPVVNIVTKRPNGVDLSVFVPAGSIQLGAITSLGIDPAVTAHKEGIDVVKLRFTTVDQLKSKALQSFFQDVVSDRKS